MLLQKKYSFKYLLCDRDSANTASSEKESSVANGVVMQQPDVEKDDEPDIADEQETTPLPGLHVSTTLLRVHVSNSSS